jgi:hypothetical protein
MYFIHFWAKTCKIFFIMPTPIIIEKQGDLGWTYHWIPLFTAKINLVAFLDQTTPCSSTVEPLLSPLIILFLKCALKRGVVSQVGLSLLLIYQNMQLKSGPSPEVVLSWGAIFNRLHCISVWPFDKCLFTNSSDLYQLISLRPNCGFSLVPTILMRTSELVCSSAVIGCVNQRCGSSTGCTNREEGGSHGKWHHFGLCLW